jgi:hypothetical protein
MENRTTPREVSATAPADFKTLDQDDFNEEDELLGADDASDESDSDVRFGADVGFDRVVPSEEAGLGGGLDQAEEARLGVTDEELAEMARRRGLDR